MRVTRTADHPTNAPRAAAAPENWRAVRSGTVLIVDDEPANVRLLQKVIERIADVAILSTTDPRDAVEIFTKQRPDLLLLDLKMPHVDGFELLERIAGRVRPDDFLPIVVITADQSPVTRRRALAAGASDFLNKPFDTAEVQLRVENLLRTRRLHEQLQVHRQELEEAVRDRTRELALFKRILDTTRDPVAIVSPGTRTVVYENQAGASLGAGWGLAALERADRSRTDAGAPATVELEVADPDLGRRVIDVLVQPLDIDGGELVVAVARDVTTRKEAEQVLRDAMMRERQAGERLREVDSLRSTFLAAVSHELRTPLTVVLGAAQTLRHRERELDGPVRSQLLERLMANGERLRDLLSDLLDLNRLHRGEFVLERRPADLAALVAAVAETVDLQGRTLDLRLEPAPVQVDDRKIERVVDNLLRNAVKHTPAGTRVTVQVEPRWNGGLIVVSDDGPGVPDDLKEAIFEPFRQGPSRQPHSPGTGIGLSLVTAIADLHGGAAWVQDGQSGGAAFHVFLPNVEVGTGG